MHTSPNVIAQVRRHRDSATERARIIVTTATNENRSLTEVEAAELRGLQEDIETASGTIEDHLERNARYAGWDTEFGSDLLEGKFTLAALRERAGTVPSPQPVSGGQERLENLVARHIERAR